MAELKAIDDGIRGIQYLRHLMRQLGLPDIDYPTPVLNDNRGSLEWIESGCKPTKKLRHENLSELGIAKAREHGEIQLYWIPGKTNPADLFTKEDNDIQHFELLRDQMVMPREAFGISFMSSDQSPARWGVLERRSDNRNSEELTTLTKKEIEDELEDIDPTSVSFFRVTPSAE